MIEGIIMLTEAMCQKALKDGVFSMGWLYMACLPELASRLALDYTPYEAMQHAPKPQDPAHITESEYLESANFAHEHLEMYLKLLGAPIIEQCLICYKFYPEFYNDLRPVGAFEASDPFMMVLHDFIF